MLLNEKAILAHNEEKTLLFEQLYAQWYHRLCRFAFSYVKDESTAENLVQDTFTKFWEKMGELDADTNHAAYLVTILKNLTLTNLNRQKTALRVENVVRSTAMQDLQLRQMAIENFDPEQLVNKEINGLVSQALAALPPQTRQVLLMSRNQHMSYQQIANHFGISTKGVGFHIGKALKQMRIHLADYLTSILVFFSFFS